MNNSIWQPLCDKSITSDYDILYCRLSRDDGINEKESDSISHQKQILSEYAAKNGFINPIFVVDDGFSGTNFQRPGWELVSQEIDKGNVRSIICKNKDRFSRDYLRTGLWMETFRDKSIRLYFFIDFTSRSPRICAAVVTGTSAVTKLVPTVRLKE